MRRLAFRCPLLAFAAVAIGCTPPPDDTTTATGDTAVVDTDTDTTVVDTDTDTTDPPGQCGEVTTWDVILRGQVENGFGYDVAGATITLEDRGWMPTTVLATTTSDIDGTFTLDIRGLTSVEDCWGTLLDYVVTGASQLGEVGEEEVNPELFGAVSSGTLEADMLTPLVVEYPED